MSLPDSDFPPVFDVLVELARHQSDGAHNFRPDRLLCADRPFLRKIRFTFSSFPSRSSNLVSIWRVVTAANPALVLDRLLVGVVVDHQRVILALVNNLLSLPEFF